MKAYFNLDGDFIIEAEDTIECVAMSRVMKGKIDVITVTKSSEEYKQKAMLQIRFKEE